MEIVCDKPEHLGDFVRLNELWIREHFSLESADRALAADPGAIARRGGHTLCAIEGGCVVGVVALFRRADDEFELARMAVDPRCRGRGIGRVLGHAALDKALARGARLVNILSNTALTPAISLYRSLGFRVVRTGTHPEYSRCNVIMEKSLEQNHIPVPDAVPGLAGKRFKLVQNSAAGSAGTDTILSFVSDDDVIVGRYKGGSIILGHVLGRRVDGGKLELLYQGATAQGEIRSGGASASFGSDGAGMLLMTLHWRWTSGEPGSGTSMWEQVR